jgi:hypothetical protein
MSSIPFTLSQVAQVAVQAIDTSSTQSAGGTGSESVFAGIVISELGNPFELIRITGTNWKSKLGNPYHPSMGLTLSEPLRHVGDAVKGGDGYVVRVVAEDARRPVLYIHRVAGQGAATFEVMPGALAFGTPLELTQGGNVLLALGVKDGNVTGRHLTMTPIASKPGSYTLTVTATDKFGVDYTVEELEVSFDTEATDDMGASTFILDRLQSTSTVLEAVCDMAIDRTGFTGFTKTTLSGGTLGNQKNIAPAQYEKALTILRNALVGYTAVLGLGCYDEDVMASLGAIARDRRVDAFIDILPTKTYQQALAASNSMAFNNNNLSLYHFPYSAKDPYSGGRAIWGISGVAFVAKAAGVAKATGAVGGWHYSPAGEERGIIDRREVQLLPGAGEPDEKAMYKARINKIGLSTTGKLMIDDALTCRQSEDYLRFQHVSSTMNAISRQFYQLANQLKHSPDGLTYDGLERGMTEILSGYVSADALVKPRNPDEDGESPYTLTVAQREIDSWEVQWGCCVTGTSRRILGSPSLIR